MNNGRDFEKFIENIYGQLSKESKIKRNDKIQGQESKIMREVDLSIRQSVANHEILIIVQARDHSRPLDVNDVGEFAMVIKDVRANKGILISAKGFSEGALELSKTNGIDALTAHEFNNPKWTLDVKMPVILNDYSGSFGIFFGMVATEQYAKLVNAGAKFPAPALNGDFKFTSDGGRTFFTARQAFYDLCMWDNLKYYDGKEHKAEHVAKLELYVADGVLVPAKDFHFNYKVTRKSYYKYFEIKVFQGLIDRINNKINPVKFRVEGRDLIIENYNVQTVSGQVSELKFEDWSVYDDSVELIHPYTLRLCRLMLQEPNGKPNFSFAGQVDGDYLEKFNH